MTTLTVELPDTLAQRVNDQQISPQRLEKAIIHFVELYLVESQETSKTAEPKWPDPAEFAHRVIASNRELFEELARLP